MNLYSADMAIIGRLCLYRLLSAHRPIIGFYRLSANTYRPIIGIGRSANFPYRSTNITWRKERERTSVGLGLLYNLLASDIVPFPIMQRGPQKMDRTAKSQREEKQVAGCGCSWWWRSSVRNSKNSGHHEKFRK